MRGTAPLLAALLVAAAACTGGSDAARGTSTANSASAATPGTTRGQPGAHIGLYLQHHGHVDGFPQLGGRAGDSALFAVDGNSGHPVANEPPIKLARYARHLTASPDGTAIAMVVRDDAGFPRVTLLQLGPNPPGDAADPEPIVWPDEPGGGHTLDIGALTWSADSQHVYWLRTGISIAEQLWVLDTATDEAAPLATLEGGALSEPMLSPGGRAMYLLRRNCCSAGERRDAYILALNATTGAELERLPLPDLLTQSASNATFAPAAVLAPDGDHLYLAHANVDAITTVTTAPLAIVKTTLLDMTPAGDRTATAPSRASSSLVSRIGGWLLDRVATTAEAKQPSFATRSARVSLDGRLLYVAGVASEPCPDDPHRSCRSGALSGLQIIDLTSMQLLHHQPNIGEVALSPDGHWLAATGTIRHWDNDAQAMVEDGFGVTLLDATAGTVVASLAASTVIEGVAFDRTGRHLYYTSTGEPGCDSCIQLTTVDLERPANPVTVTRGTRPITLVSLH